MEDETNQSDSVQCWCFAELKGPQCVWEIKPCLDDRETIESYCEINKLKVSIMVQNVKYTLYEKINVQEVRSNNNEKENNILHTTFDNNKKCFLSRKSAY